MAIKVDNLNNLFWDNGGWKFPNTHPYLIGGKYLHNITPVMTSPVTGWVILEGDFNYCEFNRELFFLKKEKQISQKKNKWRYILIKDHVCTLFKNKADVIASGILVNTDLEKLNDDDFQFTYSVLNNFNYRILLPLQKESYNWKKHIIPLLATKNFESLYALGDLDYSRFLLQLEKTKEILNGNTFEPSKYFTVLGRAKLTKKTKNWKNDLVKKINELLNGLDNEDVVLAYINDSGKGILNNKYVITYNSSHSLGKRAEQYKQVLNLDFSKLEDIELVSLVTGQPNTNTYFKVPLKKVGIQESREDIILPYIKKLSRRPRLSFLDKYSTRAIYERTGKLQTWYTTKDNAEIFYPQKIFFKIKPSLLAKSEWSDNFPISRKTESFRSVYLYYCQNLDFLFQFKNDAYLTSDSYKESDFIDYQTFLNSNFSEKSLSQFLLKANDGVEVITPSNENYYGWKKIQEPLNIGWLIGQFSIWINNQDNIFDSEKPFLIKQKATSLYRIKGLNQIVSKLIQNQSAYEPTLISEERDYTFTLDIFNSLPARARQATKEADFLIGEKLLFTSWGLPAYLLFQPIASDGYEYTKSKLTKDTNLINKWLTDASWYYAYYVFGNDDYLTENAKNWFKKGYELFSNLGFKKFYESKNNYGELKEHIKKNSNAYFITEQVEFANTPIKELNKGDIFFSDLDYFFYDHSLGNSLEQTNTEWFNHQKDYEAELQNGDVIVFNDVENKGVNIGVADVWETEVQLPDGQFISTGTQIDNDSSSINTVRTKLTKIRKLSSQNYSTLDEVINVLTNRPSEIFSNVTDFDLEELSKTGAYLFDLKGTDFYCYLDTQNKVHLVFKKGERDVQTSSKQIYAIAGNEALSKLDKTQWVNQKVNLSIYGQKIELPVKAFKERLLVTIELETANIQNSDQVFMDSHKIEVSHALGKTYLRFDTPKISTKGTTTFNAYEMERMDIANMRAFEDYLIKRKDYELGYESMDLEHKKLRFQNQEEKTSLIANTIIGGVGLVGGIATSIAKGGPIGFAVGVGGLIKTAKQVWDTGRAWHRHSQKTQFLEEGISMAIQQQAVNSYTIDLSNTRQKEDYAFNLRRAFAQESINSISSRERNQALDDKEEDLKKLSRKEDKEIYLELWTISEKQKEYAQDYHDKFGVDCRVANSLIPFGNGMKKGIYKFEDVELLNLNDRIDLILIKALLENGIKIVEWIEHEKVKELIPEDPRIAKLQQQIENLDELKKQLEQEKETLNTKVNKLNQELVEIREEEHKLTVEISEKKEEIKRKEGEISVAKQELSTQVQRYSELSNSYRNLEVQKAEEERLKTLYLEEKNKLTTDLNAEKSKVRSLNSQKTALNKKVSEAEKNLAEQIALVREKETRIQAVIVQINDKNQKLVECGTEQNKLKENNNKLTKDLEKQYAEIEELKNQLKEYEQSSENHSTIVESLQKQLNEKDKKAIECGKELNKLKDANAKLQSDLEEKINALNAVRQIENAEREGASNRWLALAINLWQNYLSSSSDDFFVADREADCMVEAVWKINTLALGIQRTKVPFYFGQTNILGYGSVWGGSNGYAINVYVTNLKEPRSLGFDQVKMEGGDWTTANAKVYYTVEDFYEKISDKSLCVEKKIYAHMSSSRNINSYPFFLSKDLDDFLAGRYLANDVKCYKNKTYYWKVTRNDEGKQEGEWTTTEILGAPKVSNYQEWLDFLGVKWDSNHKRLYPKTLLT